MKSLRIGLIDVDGHNFPNLALMKLSAYHKGLGHTVDWWNGFEQYDVIYMSKVFTDLYTPDLPLPYNAEKVCLGGTGYGLDNKLPEEVEHQYPDYSIYPKFTAAYGFLTRGCPRACGFCVVSEKEGRSSNHVANLDEFWRGQKEIKLLDPNLLAAKEHEALLQQLIDSNAWVDFTQGLDARLLTAENTALLQKVKTKVVSFAWDGEKQSETVLPALQAFKAATGISDRKARVFVLTNFDTSFDFDLYRVNTLRKIGYDPYVMIYDKPNAPQKTRHLQRWVNNKRLWRSCERFEDYRPKVGLPCRC